MSSSHKSNKNKSNAETYFTQSQKRDRLLKDEQEKARNAERDKIARLRAQRLARDAESDVGGKPAKAAKAD
jgi:hypothetical protein